MSTDIILSQDAWQDVEPGTEALVEEATRSMATLNKAAAEALLASGATINSCTDVTGFGLLGHACEVAKASRVTLEIEASSVPTFTGVLAHVARNRTGGMMNNRGHFGPSVSAAASVPADLVDLFYDPQTSGGLLVFVAADGADAAMRALGDAGVAARAIGRVVGKKQALIELA